MTQLTLPMLTVYEGPRVVSVTVVEACKTYREAVRVCWSLKPRTRLTKAQLAEETGCYASHMGDYLNEQETRRSLPAEYITVFEIACGNRVITQWLAMQARLTILETFIQQRTA
jgi:hypothetical protein